MSATSSNNILIAKQAIKYARKIIIYGSSQLENNQLTNDKFKMLIKAKNSVAALYNYDSYNQEDEGQAMLSYQRMATVSEKYSIGNCYELSLHALNYITKNCHGVFAELYEIEGGDHVFLVIGRKRDSKPDTPSTWGNKAIICDPWANQFYQATEYESKLENFYHDGTNLKNCIEAFNSQKHKVAPIKYIL